MSEQNKKIVTDFLQALGSSDVETLKALTSESICAVCTGTSVLSGERGYEDIMQAAVMFSQVTKNGLRFELLNITAEDDRVAVEAQGYSELVSGDHYNNQYHFLFVLHDGKVVQMKEYMDTKLIDAVLGPLFAA